MKKILILILACIFSIQFLNAKQIGIDEAKNLASKYYFERLSSIKDVKFEELNIIESFVINKKGFDLYYVFNFDTKGYIIISADDSVYPILGYSFTCNYNKENLPENLSVWMNEYEEQIIQIREQKLTSDNETEKMWSYLHNINITSPSKNIKSVDELLSTTWDQGNPYNALCPPGCVTGCVATAMAQIMFYYRYPLQGTGNHSYYHPDWGILSADFGAETYDWESMLNNPNQANPAIATLMYHCGVSVNMDYGASSGAYSETVPGSLSNYFGYTSSSLMYKENYSKSVWENHLIGSLDNLGVMYYAGVSSDGGHAWVCDGYQSGSSNMFHMNWGWSGSGNGFFYINNLNSGNGVFSSNHRVIKDIFPATGYPYFCEGETTLLNSRGMFEDGSGPTADYENNSNCSWLISPDFPSGYENITLNFEKFDTEANDYLTIYDGSDDSYPVLGTYSGNTLPNDVQSSGTELYVTFTTDGNGTAPGWMIGVTIQEIDHCSGSVTVSDASGNIEDGSFEYDYSNDANCKWKLRPEGAVSVTLTFTEFNTLGEDDYVKVYDKYSGGSLMGQYSGDELPPQLTSTRGSMMVMFRTDDYGTSTGWAAEYTSSTVGISELKEELSLSVFPNPTKGSINLNINNFENDIVNISLMTVTGQQIYNKEYQVINGETSIEINLDYLTKGIYLLKYTTNKVSKTKKIIIE